MIRFEDIPFQYGLCLKSDCPLADTCLRHLAVAALPEENDYATIVLPHKCIEDADGKPSYYRSNAKVRHARGFTRVLKTFPVGVLDAFRDRLIGTYPRSKYFKMRRGDILLTPKEQEFIVQTAQNKGFQGEFTFDNYEEHYLW
jgi:hypothetical protein